MPDDEKIQNTGNNQDVNNQPENETATEEKKQTEPQQSSTEDDEFVDLVDRGKKDELTKIAGYKASDLATALVKPPDPVDTEGKRATSNKNVKLLVTIGTVLAVLGLVLMLISLWLGFIVMVIGATTVMVSVFAPIR